MSLCLGCLIAAGSFAGVSGLGRITEWVTERKRARDMQSVLDEPEGSTAGPAPAPDAPCQRPEPPTAPAPARPAG